MAFSKFRNFENFKKNLDDFRQKTPTKKFPKICLGMQPPDTVSDPHTPEAHHERMGTLQNIFMTIKFWSENFPDFPDFPDKKSGKSGKIENIRESAIAVAGLHRGAGMS